MNEERVAGVAPEGKLSARVRNRLALVAAAAGLVMLAAFGWNQFGRAASGNNDFIGLYVAGRMAGTANAADFYDPARVTAIQRKTTGFSGEGVLSILRLPYYAALIWPLAQLPYPLAYAAWEALSLAAIVGFAFAWPDQSERFAILVACAWSLPLLVTMMNGQDCAFVLLAIALAIRFYERHPAFASLAIACAGIKFHLLLLVPLMVIAQRRYRILAALAICGAVLLAISFAVAGPHWFGPWFKIVTSARVSPGETFMPNLHGLTLGAPWLEWTLAVAVALMVWIVAHRGVELGWAAALIGSLLVSRHAYTQDCVVLLPACVILLRHRTEALRVCAFALLTPISYLPSAMGNPAAVILPAGLLVLLAVMAAQPAREVFPKKMGA